MDSNDSAWLYSHALVEPWYQTLQSHVQLALWQTTDVELYNNAYVGVVNQPFYMHRSVACDVTVKQSTAPWLVMRNAPIVCDILCCTRL